MITRSTKVDDDKIDASNDESAADVLIRKRIYCGTFKKWSSWQVEYRRPPSNENGKPFVLPLQLGGTVCVHPNLLSLSIQKEVAQELKNHATYFRQYRIQGTSEPRAHFLLHQDAPDHSIDDPNTKSPGYKYGQITMKARPLHLLPHLQKLSLGLKRIFDVPGGWNIGVDVVSYRDGRDSMGFHADDDQEEELIVTVLITSPPKPRRVVFKRMPDAEKNKKLRSNGSSNRKKTVEPISHAEKRALCLRDGDEEFELCLSAGDAYSMDGEMQKSYVHGVPKQEDCLGGGGGGDADADGHADADRIAIVYRRGAYTEYTRDSGKYVSDLLPRRIVQRTFGQINGLTEGTSYCRADICEMGAHRSPQGGVSGNKEEGCDAIIVSGARKDGLGDDSFDQLMYAAHTQVGAGGILTSMKRGIPIRVFRSSRLDNDYAAQPNEKNESARYRYDGLYRLVGVKFDDGSGVEREEMPAGLSPLLKGRIYKFQLVRIEVGKDVVLNRKSTNEMLKDTIEPARKLMYAKALLSLSMEGKHRRKKREALQAYFFGVDLLLAASLRLATLSHFFGVDLLLAASLHLATPSLSKLVSALPLKKRKALLLSTSWQSATPSLPESESALPIKKRKVLLPLTALQSATPSPSESVSALPIKKRKVLVQPEHLQSVQTTKRSLTFLK